MNKTIEQHLLSCIAQAIGWAAISKVLTTNDEWEATFNNDRIPSPEKLTEACELVGGTSDIWTGAMASSVENWAPENAPILDA